MAQNKSHVAIRKILHRYPDIDMELLFQWSNYLKALPHVMSWFERAKVVVANEGEEYSIDRRKLSYSNLLSLLFVPPSHIKSDSKKTKESKVIGVISTNLFYLNKDNFAVIYDPVQFS